MNKNIVSIALLALIVSCSSDVKYEYPKSSEDEREERVGSLIPGNKKGERGINLLGPRGSNSAQAVSVNGLLWQAITDTISFMPIIVSDSSGGVITTDWYVDPRNPLERVKVNVVAKQSDITSHAFKINSFRQVKIKNEWVDTEANQAFTNNLEKTILEKLKELKISKLNK